MTEIETVIRRAIAGDAQKLSEIARGTFVDTFGHLYDSRDLNAFLTEKHSIAAYEGLLADRDHALWLAEEGRNVLGYAVAGPCSLPVPNMPPQSGELARLYLTPEAKGKGLGKKLIQLTLDYLSAHFEHIYLSVYAENYHAQEFYKLLGFVKIHDYHYMVGSHADPEWIMELRR